MPVKQAVLALPYPTKTAPKNWTASCISIGYIGSSLRGQEEFRTTDYSAYTREKKEEVSKRNSFHLEESLTETLTGDPVQVTSCCSRQQIWRLG